MAGKDIVKNPNYWLAEMQIDIFREIKTYQALNNMSDEDMADFLYISTYKLQQIMLGNCNLDMYELCEIMLRINIIPKLSLTKIDDYDKERVD